MNASAPTLLDLGADEVHSPGTVKPTEKKKAMADLTPEQKKAAAKKKAAKKVVPPAAPAKPGGKGIAVRARIAAGGHLYIRHLRNVIGGTDTVFPGLVELDLVTLKDSKGPVWIQVAKLGSFKGHASGEFSITAKTFDEIISNFEATINQRIPIDYEHASEQDPTQGSIPTEGAPAQGWILKLEKRGDGLFGLVDWKEPARSQVLDGKYMFFSPAIRFNGRDRVTGKAIGARMTSGALTNQPFLDGMVPMVARDFDAKPLTMSEILTDDGTAEFTISASSCYSSCEYMPAIKWALRLPDLSTAAQCKASLETLAEMLDAAGGDGNAQFQGVYLADYLRPLRELVKASPMDTWADVLANVNALLDMADDESSPPAAPDSAPDVAASAELDDEDEEEDTDDAAMTASSHEPPEQIIMTTADPKSPTAAELEASNLKLTLKDVEARESGLKVTLSEREATIVTLTEKNKKLSDEMVAMSDKLIVDRVELAFTQYKDAKKLTDEDKADMTLIARADIERFGKRYPLVPMSAAMVDLSGPAGKLAEVNKAEAEKVAAGAKAGEGPAVETIGDRVTKIMATNPALSRDAAFQMAEREMKRNPSARR